MSTIIETLDTQFPEVRFEHRPETMLGATPVFKAVLPDEISLRDKWEQVASVIGGAFQSGMSAEQDFEKWNIYIFYVCEAQISPSLKGEIEADKFVARKIVISGNEATAELDNLINQYITGADLVHELPEPVSVDISKAFARVGSPKVALDDLEALIGGKFVEDRNKKEQRTRLNSLLDKVENRFADEINKG